MYRCPGLVSCTLSARGGSIVACPPTQLARELCRSPTYDSVVIHIRRIHARPAGGKVSACAGERIPPSPRPLGASASAGVVGGA